MTIQTAVLIETLIDLVLKSDGHHVIFFLHKIMLLQLLLPMAFLFLLGKAKQKRNMNGVWIKPSIKMANLGMQI